MWGSLRFAPINDDQDNTKRRKVDESSDVDGVWLTVHNIQLKMSEKTILLNKEELNDRINNASQRILYCQFPSLQGLHSKAERLFLLYIGNNDISVYTIVVSSFAQWLAV